MFGLQTLQARNNDNALQRWNMTAYCCHACNKFHNHYLAGFFHFENRTFTLDPQALLGDDLVSELGRKSTKTVHK